MMRFSEEVRNKAQNILLVVLLTMVLIMLYEVEKISKAGRLINYAGFARGGSQRYVKLELFGIHDQELVDRNNKILDRLWNGSEELNLPRINDKNFRTKLNIQKNYWKQLYEDTEAMEAAEGAEKARLKSLVIEESEEYFDIATDTVNAAEAYSEKLVDYLGIFEVILIAAVLCIIVLIIMDYAEKKNLLEQNLRLGRKAYIDAHTGLPNKSRCEEVFNSRESVADDVYAVMFDLNGLKATNDRLGHIAGDELIKGFADILKNSVRENDFIGRYGGDEFVGVIYAAGYDGIIKIFERIEENVRIFNEEHPDLNLSYAHGYSSPNGRSGCTMKLLLSEADDSMYKNKIAMKKAETDLML